jgi:hypothetical protein
MNYKYYACHQFNEKHEYCSHRFIKIPAHLNIKDYLNQYEEEHEETEEQYNKHMPFYQVEIPNEKQIDKDNGWMKLKGFNMTNGIYQYILWRNIDKDGKYYYQITTDYQPPKTEAGYYDRATLLKLKNIKEWV